MPAMGDTDVATHFNLTTMRLQEKSNNCNDIVRWLNCRFIWNECESDSGPRSLHRRSHVMFQSPWLGTFCCKCTIQHLSEICLKSGENYQQKGYKLILLVLSVNKKNNPKPKLCICLQSRAMSWSNLLTRPQSIGIQTSIAYTMPRNDIQLIRAMH